jgi:hypothetical protein
MPVIYLKRGEASETGILVEGEGSFLANAISYLNTSEDVQSGDKYRIELKDSAGVSNDTTAGFVISENIEVTLSATSIAAGTITKNAAGALFTILGDSGTVEPHLILDTNIKLVGYESNTNALVVVGSDATHMGKLTMNATCQITGNTNSANTGGGVNVLVGSTFDMNDGSITNNHSRHNGGYGGGVRNAGTFTMKTGSISGNSVGNVDNGANCMGGGVYNNNIFMMEGGTISGNSAIAKSGSASLGGGVLAKIFTMTDDAVIEGNTAVNGGGICLFSNADTLVTIDGGIIRDNHATNANSGSAIDKYAAN